MNRDYKEERVTQYKNLMGINTGVTTVVIGELFNGHHLGVSGILAQLKANWFVLSFENSGIILIGMDRFGHYKEQNAFLPTKKIISAKMHRRLGKKILTIMISNGKKIHFNINTTLVGCSYQHKNYKNLDNLVSKYNEKL